MTMTRQHFQLIADALHAAYADASKRDAELGRAGTSATEGVDLALGRIVDALASTNPRFDRQRFLNAVILGIGGEDG